MDDVFSCDVLYLFFDALNLLSRSSQRSSDQYYSHHSDHDNMGEAVSGLDLGTVELGLEPGHEGDNYVQGKEEYDLPDLTGVHATTVFPYLNEGHANVVLGPAPFCGIDEGGSVYVMEGVGGTCMQQGLE